MSGSGKAESHQLPPAQADAGVHEGGGQRWGGGNLQRETGMATTPAVPGLQLDPVVFTDSVLGKPNRRLFSGLLPGTEKTPSAGVRHAKPFPRATGGAWQMASPAPVPVPGRTIGRGARRGGAAAAQGGGSRRLLRAGWRRHFGLCGLPGRRELGRSAAAVAERRPRGPSPRVGLEAGGVPGGRMSAEAADREAATSSRPCTPPQTCWFEFLLEESLLEKHLRKPCPGEGPHERPPRAGAQPGPGVPEQSSQQRPSRPQRGGPVPGSRPPRVPFDPTDAGLLCTCWRAAWLA